jgi:hypothetical protein
MMHDTSPRRDRRAEQVMTIAAKSLRREIQIANLQPARPGQRQIQANERELDRDRRNEREGAEMMEERKQRGHRYVVRSG